MRDRKFALVFLGLIVAAAVHQWTKHYAADRAKALLELRRLGARLDWEGDPTNPRWVDIDFSHAGLTDEVLQDLPRVDRVRTLDLSNNPITDEGLPYLRKLSGVQRLDLDQAHITDQGLEHLRQLPDLDDLSLMGTAVTDAGLARLKDLPRLTALDLSNTKITDAGLMHLQGLHLTSLAVRNTPITDAGLTILATLPDLETLDLSTTPVTDAGLARLTELRGLRSLELNGTQITDGGLEHLAQLGRLRRLELCSVKGITDAGLAHLRKLAGLEQLGLSYTPIGDAGLAQLSRLSLCKLNVAHTRVTDAGLVHLKGMSRLQELQLDGYRQVLPAEVKDLAVMLKAQESTMFTTSISDRGLEHLRGLTSLQVLSLMEARVTDAGLATLGGLHRLRKLNLHGTSLTDAGLPHLAGLTDLHSLNLASTAVTNAGLEALRRLTRLEKLDLAQTDVDDDGLPALASLAHLRRLDLSGTAITDTALKSAWQWPLLRRLMLRETQVTDAGLPSLQALESLRYLELSGTRVTDAGLEALKNLPTLQEVSLYQTQVTREGVEAFRESGPPIHVLVSVPEPRPAPLPAGRRAETFEEPTDPDRKDPYGDPLPQRALARLGTRRLHHDAQSVAVALSPDGRVLASAGDDGRICLWETRHGSLLRVLGSHPSRLATVAFSPDGRWLASGCDDGSAFLWETATGQQVREFRASWSGVYRVVFSPDGKHLALTHFPATVRVLDLDTGRPVLELQGPRARRGDPLGGSFFRALAYCPDGSRLAAGGAHTVIDPARRTVGGQERELLLSSRRGRVCVWEFPSGKLLSRLEGDAGEVHGLAFAPDGRTLVATGADQVLRVWDTATGEERRKWNVGGPAHTLGGVALGPDGRTAVVRQDKVQVWDLVTGELVRRLDIPAGDFALSADGLLATAQHGGTLGLWELATGREVVPLARHTGWGGERLAFAPDGKTVASGGADAQVFLWERATGRMIRRLDSAGLGVRELSFSADGRRLAAAGYKARDAEANRYFGQAVVWDAGSGAKVFESPEEGWSPASPSQPVLTRDGRLVVGRNLFAPGRPARVDASILFYDLATGKLQRHLDELRHEVCSLALSPDERSLAYGSGAGTVHVLDTATLKEARRITVPPAAGKPARVVEVVFAPDGRSLAVSSMGGTSLLWDLAADRQVLRFPLPPQGMPGALAFNAQGRLLVGGIATEGTNEAEEVIDLTVWDAATGQPVGPPVRTKSPHGWVTLSPDGAVVGSSRGTGEILLWSVTANPSPGP